MKINSKNELNLIIEDLKEEIHELVEENKSLLEKMGLKKRRWE